MLYDRHASSKKILLKVAYFHKSSFEKNIFKTILVKKLETTQKEFAESYHTVLL